MKHISIPNILENDSMEQLVKYEVWSYAFHPVNQVLKNIGLYSFVGKKVKPFPDRIHCDTICDDLPRDIYEKLKILKDSGFHCGMISFYNPILMRIFKKEFPDIKLMLCDIDCPEKIDYLIDYMEAVCISPHINHNVRMIERVSKEARRNGLSVYVEVNNNEPTNHPARYAFRYWASHHPGEIRLPIMGKEKLNVLSLQEIEKLKDLVDVLIIVPNEYKLLKEVLGEV